MALDLLGRLVRQTPKPVWPGVIPGETTMGKIQPGDYKAMIKADNSWVYACARVNAQNIAKATLRLFKRLANGEREEINDHPFLTLMRNVNPHMNEFELKEMIDLYMELTGNAFIYLAPTRLVNPKSRRAIPGQIWVLMSQYVKIVPGTEQLVDGYLYQPPGLQKAIAFLAEEIVHFKFPNPDSVHYGKGPLEGAAFAVDSNEFQHKYTIGLFKNMARPDAVLMTEKTLNPDQLKRMRSEWLQLLQGANRAGNIAILQGGLDYKSIASTPKELDYLRGRIATREEIAAIFGVPGVKLGLDETASRANAEGFDITYQGETIWPRLIRIHEKINEKIMPIYDDVLEVEFDNPVPRDREHQLKRRDSNLDHGVITINEVREDEGKEKVSWGDVPILPGNRQSLGATPTPPGDGKGTPTGSVHKADRRRNPWIIYINAIRPSEKALRFTMQKFFIQQRRIVETNLNKLKGFNGSVKQNDPLVDFILFPMEPEKARLVDATQGDIERAVQAGSDYGAGYFDDMDFDVLNPAVSSAVKERVAFFSARINEETARALIAGINAGIENGESILQIADRVEAAYDQAIGFRSIRIARTETISASNRGALVSYQAGGAEGKQWITAGDEAVRNSHSAANGQNRGLQQKFQVGLAELEHPGDPNGPAGEIINCRCTTVPIVRKS